MHSDILALSVTALALGTIHTALGPDHYLPFVMMARAGAWSVKRTALVTFLCGLGHVASSVVLGGVGLMAGVLVGRLESIEAVRGDFAAFLLIVFGLAYMIWGLVRAARDRAGHAHAHVHQDDGVVHVHSHDHAAEHRAEGALRGHGHTHKVAGPPAARILTPWVLFTIFVFGPCEPLIPLLMYPAAESNFAGALAVAAVFSAATIGTMLVIVLVLYAGLKGLRLGALERYSHAVAGFAVAACGAAILFLGL
ncbi:MAG: hypothetical protein U9P14_07355 [Gemmatimonadota bacterium]|nr:hypothetical protein [Gemmatimonadota bacterium]